MKTWRDINDALRASGAQGRTCNGTHLVWTLEDGKKITTLGGGSGRQKRKAPHHIVETVRRALEREEREDMAHSNMKRMPHVEKVTRKSCDENILVVVTTSRGDFELRGVRSEGVVFWYTNDLRDISGVTSHTGGFTWAAGRGINPVSYKHPLSGSGGNKPSMVEQRALEKCEDTAQLARALSGVARAQVPRETITAVTAPVHINAPTVTETLVAPEVIKVSRAAPIPMPYVSDVPRGHDVDECLKQIRHWQSELETAIVKLSEERDNANESLKTQRERLAAKLAAFMGEV